MKYSITIPAYKSTFLHECIESVLSQTYKDFEVVIVDDHSPYHLNEIVNSFSDNRIRYIKNERNYGAIDVVDNWNKCLEYAKGKYIICMGDDDKLLPNCLEVYNDLIEKYPNLGVYHGQTELIDDKSKFKTVTALRPEYESVYSLIWHRWDNRRFQYIGDFLFDRVKLEKKGGFYKLPLAWGSDDITTVMMASESGIANTQSVVFQYRDNNTTISSTGNIDIKIDSLFKEKLWYEDFLADCPSNCDDFKYWKSAKEIMDRRYMRRYAYHLTEDCKTNGLSGLFHWLSKRKKYNLSSALIFYSFFMSFKK